MFEHFKQYRKCLDSFTFKLKAIDFIYSLDTLEQCVILFLEELEIKDIAMIEENYTYYKMYYDRLCNQLKLKNDIEVIVSLFSMTMYLLAYLKEYQKGCVLCELVGGYPEPLNDLQIERLRKENKYKITQRSRALKNKQTFEHYFYELTIEHEVENIGILKLIDSIRKRLINEGDNTYNQKDIIYSIVKYYNYTSEGFTIAQPEKDKQDKKSSL